MSAGNGGGTLHCVRKPCVQRELRAFAHCAHKQQERGKEQYVAISVGDGFKQRGILQSAAFPKQQEHAKQHARIGDSVHDECLV